MPEDRPEAALEAGQGSGLAVAAAPLRVLNNPMTGTYAVTLACIVHDEMFFLPAFLDYYRARGVDRFIVLDDRSTDGSTAYLAAQRDVMLVGSDIRYFEEIAYDAETRAKIRETRAVRLWRDQMMNQFCTDQWALVIDPDEFLSIPDGTDFPALTRALEARGAEAVWGAMIDMYPDRVGEILGAGDGARFAPEDRWYFDARPHLDPARGGEIPKTVYPGSSARLFAEWGLLDQGSAVRRLRRRLSGYLYEPHVMIHKTPLVRWRAGDWFLNCHLSSKPVDRAGVIPMMHFKFTADLGRKIEYALATGGYNRGSRSYRLYAGLIDRMRGDDASFRAKVSRAWTGHGDFVAAGIAKGIIAEGVRDASTGRGIVR